MGRYSMGHIRILRDEIRTCRLSVPEGFSEASDEDLVRAYNGIGPDAWCPILRRLVTWLLAFFEAVALIHDYEFGCPEKSYARFTAANLRFAYNAIRRAIIRTPGRYALKVAGCGLLLALLCQIFGYSGYRKV
jgi:hypothetical protein